VPKRTGAACVQHAVLRPDRSEAVRQVGEDFADRLPEVELVETIRAENLPPTSQAAPTPRGPRPGPHAVDLAWLPWHFR
jgi:hypothetical protein